jgi:hypothetical protein
MRHLERKTESKALSFSPLSDPTALHPLPLRVYVYIYSTSSTNDTLVATGEPAKRPLTVTSPRENATHNFFPLLGFLAVMDE